MTYAGMQSLCQPAGGAAGGGGLPPNRGFQLRCTDEYAYEDATDPELLRQFNDNAPPGYEVLSVEPCIYPGKNAHRFLVKYRSLGPRRCEEIRTVYGHMNNYKPQNCNVGSICVVPGGFLVEYKKYCQCYRSSSRRRRSWRTHLPAGFDLFSPIMGPGGTTQRCDDRDWTCGPQNI